MINFNIFKVTIMTVETSEGVSKIPIGFHDKSLNLTV